MFFAFPMMDENLLIAEAFIASYTEKRAILSIIIIRIKNSIANSLPSVQRRLLPFLIKSFMEINFNFIRRKNELYYYSMERDICDNKTVFRLWKIDLNKTKKVDEIEQFRFEVIDQNGMMALQALFVSHET